MAYALQLGQHHDMIDDVLEIYQLFIDAPSTTSIMKCQLYEDYSNFCVKWGLLEKAHRLLLKKMRYEE